MPRHDKALKWLETKTFKLRIAAFYFSTSFVFEKNYLRVFRQLMNLRSLEFWEKVDCETFLLINRRRLILPKSPIILGLTCNEFISHLMLRVNSFLITKRVLLKLRGPGFEPETFFGHSSYNLSKTSNAGSVVSVFGFYCDDPSSNPAELTYINEQVSG